jgi:2,3,4,5-tetrahydropyridine-2-carboxylate N-succinyltransferase
MKARSCAGGRCWRRDDPDAGTPVYDVVNGTILKATAEMPLIIPEGAVVVPGSRAVTRGTARRWGLSVYTPVIVKYRDEKTDLSSGALASSA